MKMLFGFLRKRWVLTLLGLLVLSAILWYAGPLLAFADYKPLEPERNRWIVIAALFVIWLLRLALDGLRQLRANDKLLSGLFTPAPAPALTPTQRATAEELSDLQRRMQQALDILKKMRVKGTLGTRYVYQLPWYVIIGAPGAGKTTALLNSGLRFPLAERLGAGAIRGVAGTRNCDWWFTDDAVLLDTAGRYTTQDSDREVDQAAWKGFLGMLKRHRRRRPINGVLVAVSLPDLLRQTATERERHAEEVRQRLKELQDSFGIRIPVYVLFTKCDLLAGFLEFFSDFGAEQRAQVWGTTFPITQQAGPDAALADLGNQFDALEKRLNSRVLARVQQERDPQRRALIYFFPQQFSAAREPAIGFIESVFQVTKFEESAQLRGMYFTSGTQEGTPLDRIMTSLAREVGLQQSPIPAHAGTGRSFFLTRLLKDLIFAEADLAGTNLRLERRLAWLKVGAYASIAALSVLLLSAWTVSYTRNHQYIETVNKDADVIGAQLTALTWTQPGFEVVLPTLDILRTIPSGYTERGNSPPLSMRFGLYQGRSLGREAEAAYRRGLEKMLLPRVVQRLEQQLRTGSSEFEYRFETLKVYLMLNDPRRFAPDVVQAWAQRDWVARVKEISPGQRESLRRHSQALFENPQLTQAVALDAPLVEQTRRQLAGASVARRIYQRVRQSPAAATLEEFTVFKAAAEAQGVLTRKSGRPLTSGIPGMFTPAGYHDFYQRQALQAIGAELEDGWVLGLNQGAQALQSKAVHDQVDDLYYKEYIEQWVDLLNDVTLAPMGRLADVKFVLGRMVDPKGPFRAFLSAASRDTTLASSPIKTSALGSVGTMIEETVKKTPLGQSDTPVDRRFAALHQMMKPDESGKAPIDATLAVLNEVYALVVAKAAEEDRGQIAPLKPQDEALLARLEAEAPHNPVLSTTLKEIAGIVRVAIGRGGYLRINQVYVGDIVPFCQRALAGRYPFSRNSGKDEVTQDDFGTFFAPNGKLESFYNTYLQEYLGPYSAPKNNPNLRLSQETVQMLANARVIREVFFRNGQKPGVTFELKPVRMDGRINLFILDVDGQPVRYDHGAPVGTRITWPAPGGSEQVRMQISPAAPSGTSGASEDGPWALFRMLDKAQMQRTGQPARFLVTFQIDGRSAIFELRASSVYNPFQLKELEAFRCSDRL